MFEKNSSVLMKKLTVNLQMGTALSGFTIIEFMIIVTAIVIILTMAIPSYSTNSIRSKISNSLSAGDTWATTWVCVSNSLNINLPRVCRS